VESLALLTKTSAIQIIAQLVLMRYEEAEAYPEEPIESNALIRVQSAVK
jgi:hypothetical protein